MCHREKFDIAGKSQNHGAQTLRTPTLSRTNCAHAKPSLALDSAATSIKMRP
jgi:hypothetical protein